jgi:DNA-binding GntR family transcriptional regulator
VFEASENLPEQVARVIGDRIIRNQLKPGERILEAKLAEAMGVSRSPLREALRILEKQKLVELIPRKGAKVTKISASHIIWFYDIFEALYALVARESAEKAAADRDIEAYYSAIFEFAAVGLKAARNPLLEAIMLDLWPNNRRIQFASLSMRAKDLPTNVRFFQEMHQCVIDGEPSRVEAVVRAYARNEKAFALKIANGKGPWPQEA